MSHREKLPFNRRNFLKSAGAGAAALAAGPTATKAQQQLADAPPRPAKPVMTKEAESAMPTEIRVLEHCRRISR
jgi:anaerobic selenocysteine-containing dehydrogenase